jgi:hypothetical protein
VSRTDSAITEIDRKDRLPARTVSLAVTIAGPIPKVSASFAPREYT